MAAGLRVLSVAVATGRVGYAFLVGGKLCDWGLSRKASRSPEQAASQVRQWIAYFRPDVVVTEKVEARTRKGEKTKRLIDAIAAVGRDAKLLDVAVSRIRTFKNKYAEAAALAEQFPEIKPWLPRTRRIWDPEPRNTIYFEALALAVCVIQGEEQ